MKICRYVPRNAGSAPSPRYGLMEDENVMEISGVPWGQWARSGNSSRLGDVRLLAPAEPSKIVCVGRNYAAHAAELGNELPKEPLLFLKPSTSIVGPEEPIVLTKFSQQVEHEGELALVVGRRCSHLRDSDDALSYLLGYTCLNDVTARDLQKKDVQFTRGKGFDTFCPIGPHIETDLDPSSLALVTRVNGDVRQNGNTRDTIFDCAFLIEFITSVMTLEPGDIILTGTPAGVGPLQSGDTVEVEIQGIGTLRNHVA